MIIDIKPSEDNAKITIWIHVDNTTFRWIYWTNDKNEMILKNFVSFETIKTNKYKNQRINVLTLLRFMNVVNPDEVIEDIQYYIRNDKL